MNDSDADAWDVELFHSLAESKSLGWASFEYNRPSKVRCDPGDADIN